jgi:hypothetical protein
MNKIKHHILVWYGHRLATHPRRMAKSAGKTSQWCLWRWFYIGVYLHRLKIISTPWGGIYLHKIMTPDTDPILHDHPWNFLAIMLRGGYSEVIIDKMTLEDKENHPRHFNVKWRDDRHYILKLDRTPTWTLMFVGGRARTWGFWWRDPEAENRWYWQEFDKFPLHDERVNRGLKTKNLIDNPGSVTTQGYSFPQFKADMESYYRGQHQFEPYLIAQGGEVRCICGQLEISERHH